MIQNIELRARCAACQKINARCRLELGRVFILALHEHADNGYENLNDTSDFSKRTQIGFDVPGHDLFAPQQGLLLGSPQLAAAHIMWVRALQRHS